MVSVPAFADVADLAINVLNPLSPEMSWKKKINKQAREVIVLRLAPGETEPASFTISNNGAANRTLELVATDLIDKESGQSLAQSTLELRVVKAWYQALYAWNEIGKPSPDDFRQALVPELLLKDESLVRTETSGEKNFVKVGSGAGRRYVHANPKALAPVETVTLSLQSFEVRDAPDLQPVPLGAGQFQQIWVSVKAPPTASAGTYTGTIGVLEGDRQVLGIPVAVHVHPFALEPSRLTYSIYYRGRLSPGKPGIGSEEKTIEQLRNELTDIREHGISSPTMYQPYRQPDLLAKELQLRKQLGIAGGPLYFLGLQTTDHFLGSIDERGRRKLAEVLPSLRSIATSVGYSSLQIYGRDEASGQALTAQRGLWKTAHEAGAEVFAAGYSGSHSAVGDLLDTLVHAKQPSRGEAEQWHKSGHKILNYANPQSGPENPYLFRLNYGLLLWASDYDGAMPYAYQHCFGSCWNDIDHKTYRDHVFAYPAADGPIPTMAWEGLREGIDDTRYVATLERAISRRPQSDTAKAAREYLVKLRDDVLSQQGRGKYNQNAAIDLDGSRRQIAEHVVKVNSTP